MISVLNISVINDSAHGLHGFGLQEASRPVADLHQDADAAVEVAVAEVRCCRPRQRERKRERGDVRPLTSSPMMPAVGTACVLVSANVAPAL